MQRASQRYMSDLFIAIVIMFDAFHDTDATFQRRWPGAFTI